MGQPKAKAKASAPRARAKPARVARDPLEVAREIVASVARDGALPKAGVSKAAGGSARALEVFDALTKAGLEIGAKFVRQPLEPQVEAVVDAVGPLPVRGLERRVKGASPRETADAVAALTERGRVRLITRKNEVLLASRAALVVEGRSLERLAAVVKELGVSLRTAAKKNAPLLQADLEALLRPLMPAAVPAVPAVPATSGALGDVGALVEQHRERSGLTSVPKLVRLLGGAAARDALHAELLRGARAGRFELRPESGMGRLSPDELALCIPGPQGSHLSWVRRIEES